MLDLLLKARLPIISVTCRDRINQNNIATWYANTYGQKSNAIFIHHNRTFTETELEDAYSSMVKKNAVALLVNCQCPQGFAIEAGEMPTPRELVGSLFKSVIKDEKALGLIVDALSGLSLKEAGECVRLASSTYKELSPKTIAQAKRLVGTVSPGLHRVVIEEDFQLSYLPHWELYQWLDLNRSLLTTAPHPWLTPRGILFDGPPGTGKTEGAKFLSVEMGLPLNRVDLGGMLSKWQGESEENLTRVIAEVERDSPCILLLDELDKFFSKDEHNGSSRRILSHLLWWLSEHKSKVLTVATSNNLNAIPPELIRPGRFDEVIKFEALSQERAVNFLNKLILGMSHKLVLSDGEWSKVEDMVRSEDPCGLHTPATLKQTLINKIKEMLAKKSFDKLSNVK